MSPTTPLSPTETLIQPSRLPPPLPTPPPPVRCTFPDACVLETGRDIFSLPLSREIVLLAANRNAVSSWGQSCL